jgi:hypothetical protein
LIGEGLKRISKMKLKIGSLAAITMAAALATAVGVQAQKPSLAATSESTPASDLPLADYQAFETFAAAHPDVVNELGQNPQLLQDQHYLEKHPALNEFLATHAELRGALIDDPGDFIEPNRRHPR